MLQLIRAKENPILSPTDLAWENMLVFNPGAIVKDNKIYLIYRAQGKEDIRSRLGLAVSEDGIHFERQKEPLYYGQGHSHESLGIEDPRVVKIDDTYFLTYTAVSEDLIAEIQPDWKEKIAKKPRIGLSTTKDFLIFQDYDVIIPHLSGKNSSFFPKKINGEFWLLYRAGFGKTFFTKSSILTEWPTGDPVFEERPGSWDCKRVGIGTPPIETEKGWLIFYHGVDDLNVYRLGILFLDITDPRKVIYRSTEPVLQPMMAYERFGYVSNVVFTCGAVEKNDMYYVYYGAADQVVGLATVAKKDVLALL